MNAVHQKPLNQSAFWRIKSPRKLAEILNVNLVDMEDISASWLDEYHQFPSGERWIETPKDRLKKIQKRIHNLLARIGPPEYLFSGFKGRSSFLSATRHDGSKPMIKLDIRKFYPSSNGRLVFDLFRNKFECETDVCAIMFKLCTIKSTENSKHSHLPTGGVTSPILAYFCYMDMFEEISRVSMANGLVMSVMADDIVLSGDNANSKILCEVEAIMYKHGLVSHLKKRRSWPASHPNKIVTGVQITPKGLRVPHSRILKINEFQAMLLNSKNVKERAKAYQKLCGALSSAGQIEEKFKVRAQKTITAWRSDKEAWSLHLKSSAFRRSCPPKIL